ncbi:MAG TPA: Flp family type IVb pilin [Bryobacteraceae bacterium]|nr:Flp family type IVb pilin [Bryobacteraceae bacterium]
MRNVTLKLYVKLQSMRASLRRLVADESGQDLIEYALVVALIAFAAAAGMTSVATKINAAFTNIGTKLTTYTS